VTTAGWFEQRARLNHDFLLNHVLLSVVAALRTPTDLAGVRAPLRSFLARAGTFRTLLSSGPETLRPGSWAASKAMLGNGPAADAAAELLDLLFGAISTVPAACRAAADVVTRAEEAARLALADLTEARLRAAEAELRALSQALSRLPSSMRALVNTMS
jgi:hypothetical protein